MKSNEIQLAVTQYPINLNYQQISHLTKKYGVKYSFYAPNKENSQWHFPIDVMGTQDKQHSYNNCRKGNNCTNINIINGRLYMCPISCNIKYFNKYFKKDCEVKQEDYLKLNEINNVSEINDFMSKPTPFCKYCNVNARTFNNKWEMTKKKIEEWI